MSRVAAVECAPNQIRVVAMCPGLVKSPGHVEAAKEVDDFLLTTVPMGRFGVVEEITDGLIFLCSDMASFLTGNAFEIDGGCAAR
jgi:NAD(P)-dependent dehydrogenase (short-subunit alcohol dehydrogenase family)